LSAPVLSIVTICRNVLPALRRTVESVRPLPPGVEHIVVDGASTDGTAAYLETLAAGGVRVLSEPDRGISDAMNKGVRLARGVWIAHLHADDSYLPGALARVIAVLRQDDADIVCGAIVKVERQGEVVCLSDPSMLEWDMTINHPATFVRRALFERLGGFDTRLRNAMDYDFFLRARLGGARFRTLSVPIARVTWGGQSERSIWKTLHETHMVRRRYLPPGLRTSKLRLVLLYLKGTIRLCLQQLGLHGVVRAYRWLLARPRKY
jgi:glycosyltransferase involved in cell wall biosynthesis